MSNRVIRGSKRICQSETCAVPFYDLNRTEFSCPTCGTVFDLTAVLYPRAAPTSTAAWKRGNRAYQRPVVAPVAEVVEEDVEIDTESTDDTEADAPTLILEDEDDGSELGEVIKPPADDRGEV
jgi:uncharacterized protein (TIGR02300 family)